MSEVIWKKMQPSFQEIENIELRNAVSLPTSWMRAQCQALMDQATQRLESALRPFFSEDASLHGALNLLWPVTDQNRELNCLADVWTGGSPVPLARTLLARVGEIDRARIRFS